MNSISKLYVKYHGKPVGELTMTPDGKRCVFCYDKEWLATGFSISPLDLPLKSDLFIAPERPFWGNFGIFEDSLPDCAMNQKPDWNPSKKPCLLTVFKRWL